jgi:hypothetical protein
VHIGRVEKVDYRLDHKQVPERVLICKVRSEQKDELEDLSKLLRQLRVMKAVSCSSAIETVWSVLTRLCVWMAILPPDAVEVWNRICVRMRLTKFSQWQ